MNPNEAIRRLKRLRPIVGGGKKDAINLWISEWERAATGDLSFDFDERWQKQLDKYAWFEANGWDSLELPRELY